MVVHEAGQQVGQGPTVGRAQRGEELVLGGGEQIVEVGEFAAAQGGLARRAVLLGRRELLAGDVRDFFLKLPGAVAQGWSWGWARPDGASSAEGAS
ncbi:hypothetical protein [Streptomyces sp. SID5614]|uniref:hypothetical protein n=1 Tax=Streptomyces sp. SID5614 TaxID=2690306 RepID=UPI00136EE672|nr:hypothetical protein [Streptomyces sp. SID5614]MZG05109.1 hypothetical protein [Streptomyces sp. SID5614]